jgi:SAM-dependent methyltransferase
MTTTAVDRPEAPYAAHPPTDPDRTTNRRQAAVRALGPVNGRNPRLPGRCVLLRGDAGALPLPDESVDLVVTSPPYWAQRSYTDGGAHYAGQLGDEPDPGQYIERLVDFTAEWARVIKPGGSIFVNLGDKYAARANAGPSRAVSGRQDRAECRPPHPPVTSFARDKSLLGLPWRYALRCIGAGSALADPALVKTLLADVALGVVPLSVAEDLVDALAATPAAGPGLILRAEILWNKTNGMPESVQDRVRRDHEHLFHFTKSTRYHAGIDAVREPLTSASLEHDARRRGRGDARLDLADAGRTSTSNPLGKLPGTVWDMPTQPLTLPPHVAHARCCAGTPRPGCAGLAHYAAFPMDLPRRIIAGWSPSGICTACGEGRRPLVERPGRLGGDNNPQSRDGTRARSTLDGGSVQWRRRIADPDRLAGEQCACPRHLSSHPPRGGAGPVRRHRHRRPGRRRDGPHRHQPRPLRRLHRRHRPMAHQRPHPGRPRAGRPNAARRRARRAGRPARRDAAMTARRAVPWDQIERDRADKASRAPGAPRDLGSCEGPNCSAKIRWAKTEDGGRMPVDYLPDPDGRLVRVMVAQGDWRIRVLAAGEEPEPGALRWTSHYATCPDAEWFRARGRGRAAGVPERHPGRRHLRAVPSSPPLGEDAPPPNVPAGREDQLAPPLIAQDPAPTCPDCGRAAAAVLPLAVTVHGAAGAGYTLAGDEVLVDRAHESGDLVAGLVDSAGGPVWAVRRIAVGEYYLRPGDRRRSHHCIRYLYRCAICGGPARPYAGGPRCDPHSPGVLRATATERRPDA